MKFINCYTKALCGDFYVYNNQLIYLNKSYKIVFNSNIIEGKFYVLTGVGNKLFTYDNEIQKTVVYSLPNFEKIYENDCAFSLRLDLTANPDSSVLFGQISTEEEPSGILFEISTFKILKKIDFYMGLNGIWKLLPNLSFISNKDNLLSCHDLNADKELWRVDIAKETGCEFGTLINPIDTLLVFGNRLYTTFIGESSTKNISFTV